MTALILRRLLLSALVALTVSMVVFGVLRLSGDLAITLAGERASEAVIQEIRIQYGLDRSLPIQYAAWLGDLLRGNFGNSYYTNEPVGQLLADKLPITATLGLAAIVLAIAVAVPLGVAAAVWPNTWIDRACQGLALIGQAMPAFWLSLLLMLLFAVQLRWLPVSGTGTWKHFVMPTLALSTYAIPAIMRLTRGGMIEVLQSDYVRMARAKGLPGRTVVFKHALRNALLPVVALTAVQLGFMLGGSVVIESVFALQGVGYLAWESILRNDFIVVQAIVLMLSLFYVLLTFLADLVNAWLDPRLRAH